MARFTFNMPDVGEGVAEAEIVEWQVKVGDTVAEGQKVAAVEAMKAEHDIKSQYAGTVTAIHVKIGDEIDSSNPILTIS